MERPPMEWGALVGGALRWSLPALLALVALMLLGQLPIGAGILAYGLILLGVGVLEARRQRGLEQLRRGIDALAGDARPPQVIDAPAELSELAGAALRLQRTMTERQAELAAWVESRERVIEAVPDPLLMIDRHGRIVRANGSARGLLGADLEGRALTALIRHPEVLDAVEAALGEQEPREVEVRLAAAVDQQFRVGVRPLAPAAPDGTALLLSFYDITAVRRAEQMRGDFVANASHELRTPLATLIGFLETLRGPARDDDSVRDRFLGIMHEQASRMARLVDDLLSLSRIEQHEHQPPSGRIDLRGLLIQVAALFELQAARRRSRIEIDLPDQLPPVIGDPDELTQLFQNLVDNGLKYGRPGTPLRLAATTIAPAPLGLPRAAGPSVRVTVADQGEGIAREHLPRLTERFYRVDAATSKAAGGTGLGLAIVKHIVARHRGLLTIDSEVGRGSTFTVHLPAAAGQGELPVAARRLGR